MGPSGAGRSMLLEHPRACTMAPGTGSTGSRTKIGFDRLSPKRRAELNRRYVGFVFQHFRSAG